MRSQSVVGGCSTSGVSKTFGFRTRLHYVWRAKSSFASRAKQSLEGLTFRYPLRGRSSCKSWNANFADAKQIRIFYSKLFISIRNAIPITNIPMESNTFFLKALMINPIDNKLTPIIFEINIGFILLPQLQVIRHQSQLMKHQQ